MPPLRPLRSTDPREIAGYVLHGRLGEGGQGTVFFGTSPAGVKVAVKLLHDGFGSGSDVRRFFDRELAALQRVAPFCTARVLAADPGADPPYVVSEYVEGPSVLQAVRERGVLTGADLDRLAIATATALGAIHAAGVVHRDFKPANVLLAADGGKVADHPCFRPGTGIADYEYGSGRLYLNNEGHNYLVGTRVSHQSGTQDKVFVSRFFRDQVDTAVADQRRDVYLTVFRDLDGDGTFKRAGEGEYEYLILHFPT
ncbi:protein kinase [Nonomuraea sp. NPDC050691]|uniref:protein kinase domain-containing protein n=1 Tax=Nonomuraea sp. NPDC050691 TaxID=3155661 RepID=UPI00341085EB